ncbi:hypothetical protein [Bradyrhizobium sp. LA2.1]|uniref:AMP-binding enzyme n=1 Tax=Bradyrhizobium sp. LA2.1 TaxID=3156376 RepID=UPI00339986F6
MCLPCETIEIRNPNQQNLTGRQKDRIIRRGHSIDPGTVEDACFSHPGISLCAPVGQIDVNEGEIPVAFVVMKPGYNPRHRGRRTFAPAVRCEKIHQIDGAALRRRRRGSNGLAGGTSSMLNRRHRALLVPSALVPLLRCSGVGVHLGIISKMQGGRFACFFSKRLLRLVSR